MAESNRDPRFPPHEDIVEGILGWGYSGPYSAEELHDGLAETFELHPELLEVMGGNGQTRWTNYIAHGLRALTIRTAHEKIDGVYHLTERGRILAKRVAGGDRGIADTEEFIRRDELLQRDELLRRIMRDRGNGSPGVWAEHLSSREKPEPATMTPEEFRDQLHKLDLRIRDFADLVGLSEATVAMWGRERHERGLQKIPHWVPLLLAAWSAHPELVPALERDPHV